MAIFHRFHRKWGDLEVIVLGGRREHLAQIGSRSASGQLWPQMRFTTTSVTVVRMNSGFNVSTLGALHNEVICPSCFSYESEGSRVKFMKVN